MLREQPHAAHVQVAMRALLIAAILTLAALMMVEDASASVVTPEPAVVREAPPKLQPAVAKTPELTTRTVLRCRRGVCVHASTKTAVGSTPPERPDTPPKP